MNYKYYLRKSRDVKWRDTLAVFPMAAGRIMAFFAKNRYRDVWAIAERKTEARDNGYHFFKYMVQNHPEQKCVYVIDKNCPDYQKVKNLGQIVQFGSIRHWMLYFSCRYLISSQRFLPNGYLGTLLERMKLCNPEHVFLQHGITINKPEYLRADRWKVKLFIAAVHQEANFVVKELGYAPETVVCTGFSRFDALHDFQVKKNRIMIMPTWRKWLQLRSEQHDGLTVEFEASEYYQRWKEFLSSADLSALIEKYGLEVIFVPHPNMRSLPALQKIIGPAIHMADIDSIDLQELMKSSEMIITDYSSVFFDMAYMKKPVIFYQFDAEQFRKYHYEEGWFHYNASKLGRICTTSESVTDTLNTIIDAGYQVDEAFLGEHGRFFELYDQNNSQRIYDAILRAE